MMQSHRRVAVCCSCYLACRWSGISAGVKHCVTRPVHVWDRCRCEALSDSATKCELELSRFSVMTCLLIAGDERPGQRAGDVVIVIDEKPHPLFTREGNDLHYTHRLPLADALCGPTMHVPTLDGRRLDVVMEGVAHPNAVKVVRGEGMPISKAPGTRGDLRIHFDIIFPKSLSPQQKAAVRANLPAR